jgi:hypothetical protein
MLGDPADPPYRGGKVFPVCGNTCRTLQQTRFAPHFELSGAFDRHYCLFEGCGSSIPFDRGFPANSSPRIRGLLLIDQGCFALN